MTNADNNPEVTTYGEGSSPIVLAGAPFGAMAPAANTFADAAREHTVSCGLDASMIGEASREALYRLGFRRGF